MIEDGVVIRPLTRRDLPAMAVMRRKVFRTSAQPDPEALARYYELVLFDGPWMSDDLPSLVATTRSGRVLGFQALVQRPFRLGDRALRCAVATEFMVDPDSRRRGVGGLLVRALFDGPQDFTLTDRCNAAARRLFESLGGSVSTWHSWYWTAVLRPARHAIGQLGWRGIPKLSTPLTSAFDAAVTRVVPGTFRQSLPRGSEGGLDPSIVPRLLPDFAGTGCLIPAYTSDHSTGYLGAWTRASRACTAPCASAPSRSNPKEWSAGLSLRTAQTESRRRCSSPRTPRIVNSCSTISFISPGLTARSRCAGG